MTEDKKQKLQDSGLVEWSVFSELVAMDEDEEGFSKGLFQTFGTQFKDTLKSIDESVRGKDLDQLSSLGHYLKGSAAALGLSSILAQCERIQNYGHKTKYDDYEIDTKDSVELDEYWIAMVEDATKQAKADFDKAKKALNDYFDDELW